MQTNKRKILTKENKKALIIALVLFANLVIANAKYINYVYGIIIIVSCYCFCLIYKKPHVLKQLFIENPLLWIILFAIEMFIYGYFGAEQSAYSLNFHMLNVLWIITLLIIFYHTTENLLNVITKACSLEIILVSIFILYNGSFNIIDIFTRNEFVRVGYTAVGNVNTTAISYIFLLIPIIYKISVERTKIYLPFAVIGIIFMLLTGSKKGIFSILLMIFIIGIQISNHKSKLLNIFKASGLLVLALIVCYFVPSFHALIWDRLESMFLAISNFNMHDQSSTGLRINFILTAFARAWDKPFLGHGWASFAPLYGYNIQFNQNLYTHNNYAEILFSFGLLGLFLYYWFPIKMIIKTLKNKNKNKKIISSMYITIFLFIDFSSVTCYDSILGFLGFIIVYFLLKTPENALRFKTNRYYGSLTYIKVIR